VYDYGGGGWCDYVCWIWLGEDGVVSSFCDVFDCLVLLVDMMVCYGLLFEYFVDVCWFVDGLIGLVFLVVVVYGGFWCVEYDCVYIGL